MQRTQIYLPKHQIALLRKEAQKRRTTVSEVIRRALEEKMSDARKRRASRGETLLQAMDRINALGPSGPSDLATNMDEYLYGGKK